MKNLSFVIIVTAAVAFFGIEMTAVAQSVANYTPTLTTGITYNSILSTGHAVSAWRNTDVGDYYDDNRSQPVLIGFDFWYDGKRYTQFSVSTNGFLDLDSSSWNGGSGLLQPKNPYGPYSTDFVNPTRSASSGGVGTVTALAPFYYDLTTWQTTVPLGNSIMYLLTGTAPNRVLTVEWNNMSAWTNQNDTLNFQAKLYESTGVIEYTYGYMSGTIPTNYGFGYVTGINAPSISPNPPTAAQLLCLQTANTNTFSNGQQNQLATMMLSYSKYTFTPQIPSDPSNNLTFTVVAPNSMTLNWVDNASNEVGYVIYSSLDGLNYTYTTQVAANSTSYTATDLSPETTYNWKVYAVTEGGLSASSNGSQATTAAANFTSQQNGLWNTGTTWVDGVVPTVNANVTIANGHTVTIDGNITINNITVGQGTSGTLQIGNDATALTLNVLGNITVNAGAQFAVNTGFATSGHILNLTGNILNNGTFDLGPSATSRCQATFNKSGNQTIGGTGATTRFYLMTLNMGSTNYNILDITASNFLTQSTGFLTITNGTFKYEAPSAITPFTANTTVPLTGGLWVNNSSAIVTTTCGNLSVRGFVRVTNGVLNVGTAADQQLLSNGGTFIIEGGAVNVAGSFASSDPFAIMNFTISGGTFTVATVGSTLSGKAPFMLSIAGSTFDQTGGTVVIRNAGNGNLGYVNMNTSSSLVLGGTLQIGDYSTLTAQTIQINSTIPVYNLVDSSANATMQLMTNNLTVNNNVLIAAGTLDVNNLNINVQRNWTNQGTFTPGTGTVTFNGSPSSLITKATGESFYNLTINKSSNDVSLGGAATVNGTLNFASAHNLLLGTNNLTLNGSVIGAADGKCVVTNGTGAVSKVITAAGSFTFPVGSSTDYRPVILNVTALIGSGPIAVKQTDANPGSTSLPSTVNNISTKRYWTITPDAGITAIASDVTLRWGLNDDVSDLAKVTVVHGIAGGAWDIENRDGSTTGDATSGSVTGSAFTTLLGDFTLGNQTGGTNLLPVEMTSFTAVMQGTSVLLKWTTATETNNAGFQIERSVEGSNVWAEVAFVAGAGTVSSPKAYSYKDKNLAPGAYVYRIKQIDNDGKFKYYTANMPKVDAGVSNTLQLCGNYPNPFNPTTNMQFSVPQDGYASLKIYNILGQEVATLFSGIAKTGHYIPAMFDASRLASGIYFARLQYNDKSLVQRMLLTK